VAWFKDPDGNILSVAQHAPKQDMVKTEKAGEGDDFIQARSAPA
jgi:hypothetical protein